MLVERNVGGMMTSVRLTVVRWSTTGGGGSSRIVAPPGDVSRRRRAHLVVVRRRRLPVVVRRGVARQVRAVARILRERAVPGGHREIYILHSEYET